jgi:hypothetical protein
MSIRTAKSQILGLLSAFCLLGSPSWARPTVCTVAINSTDEIEVFKKHLSKDFDFIELTKYQPSGNSSDTSAWFGSACEAGVQCDVLLISGHFGGSFFGTKSGLTLPLEIITERSCRRTCDGMLKKPKEVFLFGCNTLGTKQGGDHRPTEEYIQVLVGHGQGYAEAQRNAAVLHSPFGQGFADQMQRAFEGVGAIYGFDGIGPSGANVRASLDQYFQKVGDYQKHLEGVTTANNQVLASVMKQYTFVQKSSLQTNSTSYDVKQNICKIHDDQTPTGDRIATIHRLLQDAPVLYAPSAGKVLANLSYVDANQSKEKSSLITDIGLRDKLWTLVSDMKGLAFSQVELLKLMKSAGWIDKEELEKQIAAILKPGLSPLDVTTADLYCSATEDKSEKLNIPIRFEDIGFTQATPAAKATLVSCIKTTDPRFTDMALSLLKGKLSDPMQKYHLLDALRSLPDRGNLVDVGRAFMKNRDVSWLLGLELVVARATPEVAEKTIIDNWNWIANKTPFPLMEDQMDQIDSVVDRLIERGIKSEKIATMLQPLITNPAFRMRSVIAELTAILPTESPQWLSMLQTCHQWRDGACEAVLDFLHLRQIQDHRILDLLWKYIAPKNQMAVNALSLFATMPLTPADLQRFKEIWPKFDGSEKAMIMGLILRNDPSFTLPSDYGYPKPYVYVCHETLGSYWGSCISEPPRGEKQ